MADPFVSLPIPSEEISDLDFIAGEDIDIDADLILIRNVATGTDRKAIVGDAVSNIVNTDISNRIRFVATFSDLINIPATLNQPIYLEGVTGILGDRSGFFVARSGSVTSDGKDKSNSSTAGLYWDRTSYDAKTNIEYENYLKMPHDLSGEIQTHGKKVVITGDSLSYNNYGFGFAFAGTAQEANAGIRSWGFLLRDAIHMSDPCFVYGDNIPWHINNPSYAATAINNTNPFVLPFNNRSLRFVVSNSAAEITLTLNSFHIVNKQIVLHLAHSPGQPGKFNVYYNDNNGGGDVLLPASPIQVGNGVGNQGYAPFTLTIPLNTLDCGGRIILKGFTNVAGAALSTAMAFYVLAAGSKLTNVYTTGVGGTTSEYTNTNFTTLAGQYTPDVLVLCTGANDRVAYGIDRHITALDSIFTKARAANPQVRIIHITTPPATGMDNPGFYPDTATGFGSTMREWVSAVERLCRDRNVFFFNQYRFLYDINNSYLFVDGIHLTRNAGRDVFKAIMSEFFSKCGAPIEHLHGYSTYSVQGTGDLMGHQIGAIESTRATPRVRGQFRMQYTHGAPGSWSLTNTYEYATTKPCAIKNVVIDGTAHTNNLEFYIPCVANSYNEFSFPLNASVEYTDRDSAVSSAAINIGALSIKPSTTTPRNNNILVFTIRDSAGALIDPSTMSGARFLVKYWQ